MHLIGGRRHSHRFVLLGPVRPRQTCLIAFLIGAEADKIAVGLHANSTDLTYPLILCALAAKNDVVNIKAILSISGINPSASDYDGRSPLHVACDEGHFETAKLLVEHGADVNATDRWGNTPLLCAFMRERMQLVSFLKERGARLRVLNMEERLKDLVGGTNVRIVALFVYSYSMLCQTLGVVEELKHMFDKMGGGGPCDYITLQQLTAAMDQHGLDSHRHHMLKKEIKQLVGKEGKVTWNAFQAAFEKCPSPNHVYGHSLTIYLMQPKL